MADSESGGNFFTISNYLRQLSSSWEDKFLIKSKK